MTNDQLREGIEHAMHQALATFPTNTLHRNCYLIAYLVAIANVDVALANRFLRVNWTRCD